MTIFKKGDKVKLVGTSSYYGVNKGDIGIVVDDTFNSGCDVTREVGDWDGCETLFFYDSELEKVDVNLFQVGQRVRLITDGSYTCCKVGETGTIVKAAISGGWYDVEPDAGQDWDGFHTLTFTPKEIERVLEEAEPVLTREQVLENAVKLAHGVFVEYMMQHLAKGDTGKFKARTNLGFATIMEQALAYKAD